MHRSGTSFAASVLEKAGVFIGGELMIAGVGNEKGFFENLDFVHFHERVFQANGLSKDGWDLESIDDVAPIFDAEASALIEINEKAVWAWKNPRTTLFINYWKKKIPHAKLVFIFRNPWEVVDSIYRRATDLIFQEKPEHAFYVWDFYNKEIIKSYKRYEKDSIIIDADDFTTNTSGTVDRISNRFGLSLDSSTVENLFDKAMYKKAPRSALVMSAFPELIETLNELRKLSGKELYNVSELQLLLSPKEDTSTHDWMAVAFQAKALDELRTIKSHYEALLYQHTNLSQSFKHIVNEKALMEKSIFWKACLLWRKISS